MCSSFHLPNNDANIIIGIATQAAIIMHIISTIILNFSPPQIQISSSSKLLASIHNGAAMVDTAATVAVITTMSFKILNKPILSPLFWT